MKIKKKKAEAIGLTANFQKATIKKQKTVELRLQCTE